jgi:hypothetical protein
MKALNEIQIALKAPKGQFNSFGKYSYRSCEDILEAVKPLLGECSLIVSDSVEVHGDRVYIKATATLPRRQGLHQGYRHTAYPRRQYRLSSWHG